MEREAQKIRRALPAVMKAVSYARDRGPALVQFTMRQYRMEKEMAESVFDAIMENFNPRPWLTDQEIQIELNGIAEQTKTKLTTQPADVADFALVKQIAEELSR